MHIIKGISVVICCYNSANRLPDTLKHLFEQQINSYINWEIIVVDNASKDNTESIANDLYRRSGSQVPFRVIRETKPGLNYARDAGLHAAKFEYILWVDDDNWLGKHYLETSFTIMEANPAIGMLGGQGEPVLDGQPPAWFASFKVVYALGPQAQHSGEIRQGYVYGAGATIRKSAWLIIIEAGFKSILTDRKGASLASGGDVELADTLRLANYKLWYDERLTFKHYIPSERLTWNYLLRLAKGTGESGLSSALHYFLKKFPDISLDRFKYLYYKRCVWLLVQLIKNPGNLFHYFFNRQDDSRYSTFYVVRNIALFTSSLKQERLAVSAYQELIQLKIKLQGHQIYK